MTAQAYDSRPKMNCWYFDIRRVSLDAVLSWALAVPKTDKLLFTMRLSQGKRKKNFTPSGVEKRVRQSFGLFVESFWATGWPGTELVGHKGRVWVTDFNETVKALVLRTQPDFSKWLNDAPYALPEDLCLFKQGNQYPTLISCTHEKDAWLFSVVKPAIPGIQKSPRLLEDFIFSGKYFCREAEL